MATTREQSATLCEHCGLPVPRARVRRGGESAAYCCMGCHVVHQMVRAGEDDTHGSATNPYLLRLGLGIFLTMNIMAFSGFFYSIQVYDAAGQITSAGSVLASLLSYLLLLLCTLVILLMGGPLLQEALDSPAQQDDSPPRRWCRWSIRMDVNLLILLGVVTAYALSAVSTLRGQGHLYYDTAAMILLLVTLGSHLDARAKRKAAASSEALLAGLPSRVFKRCGDQIIEIEAAQVQPDDLVRVRPGEALAIDGIISEGAGYIDESILTGESRHRSVAVGDSVMAASINLDGLLWVRASAGTGHRVIDHVKRMLDEARTHQPAVQRLADRVAAVFVPLVMVLAVAVFAWHGSQRSIEAGLFTALSVLLISCPCALGLAAPLACYHALTRAAQQGILIDSPATLEKLAAIRSIIFDKTGTLTRGQMSTQHITTMPGVSTSEALSLAASIESATNHPIALAIIRQAVERGVPLHDVRDARLLPGLGIEGTIGQRNFLLGNATLAAQARCNDDPLLSASETGTDVFLIENHRILACFTLVDEARPEAPQVIARLASLGMSMTVLTGDQPGPARRLCESLGLPFVASLLPAGKVTQLEQLRSEQRGRFAFVGDGINDAPAMGSADVGIAVGNATDLARQAGHVHLMAQGLSRLPLLFELARDAVWRVRLNLLWAFGYNAIGLTLATFGLLTPIFAASSMIVSSLLIVVTSSSSAPTSQPASSTPPVPQRTNITPLLHTAADTLTT